MSTRTGQSCAIKHLLDRESHNKIEFDKAKTRSDALITIPNSPVMVDQQAQKQSHRFTHKDGEKLMKAVQGSPGN